MTARVDGIRHYAAGNRFARDPVAVARIVVPPPGVPVGTLVAQGKAELGFQQWSELMNVAGIDVLGPLPPAIQTITTFSGGVGAQSTHVEAARHLLAHMAAPAAADLKRRFGMEPA